MMSLDSPKISYLRSLTYSSLFYKSTPTTQSFFNSLKSLFPKAPQCQHCLNMHLLKPIGDLILINGFYGSNLRSLSTNKLLLSEFKDYFTNDNLISTDFIVDNTEDNLHVASGLVDKFGIFDLCSKLITELKGYEECPSNRDSVGNKKFTFHTFAYLFSFTTKFKHHPMFNSKIQIHEKKQPENNEEPLIDNATERQYRHEMGYRGINNSLD